jgi:hypothetical protein
MKGNDGRFDQGAESAQRDREGGCAKLEEIAMLSSFGPQEKTDPGDFAQNSKITAKPRTADPAEKSRGPKPKGKPRGRPYVPGQSGNPGGRPKDALGIQRLALELCPEALEKLAKLMREAESERAQASAASAILDRGCGKPTQPVDGRLDVTWHVSDQPMDPDEWRKQFTDQ